MGEDGDFVFEGEGVFGGEFGALDAFDGVGCCGGAGVCATFYYGEGSCAELLFVVVCWLEFCMKEREGWNEQRHDIKDDLQKYYPSSIALILPCPSCIICPDIIQQNPCKFISSSLYK